jgi:hypothetical protein
MIVFVIVPNMWPVLEYVIRECPYYDYCFIWLDLTHKTTPYAIRLPIQSKKPRSSGNVVYLLKTNNF